MPPFLCQDLVCAGLSNPLITIIITIRSAVHIVIVIIVTVIILTYDLSGSCLRRPLQPASFSTSHRLASIDLTQVLLVVVNDDDVFVDEDDVCYYHYY